MKKIGGQWILGGGAVTFQIYWPPGPVAPGAFEQVVLPGIRRLINASIIIIINVEGCVCHDAVVVVAVTSD